MSFARSFRLRALVLAGGIAGVGIAACSKDTTSFEPGADGPGPFAQGDAALPPAPEADACAVHCSRDLKQVLQGCEGAESVVATCNADQGCGDGKCVDACTAATLSKGSNGCDFWTLPPDDIQYGPGSCFAAMITNTWDRPVAISAEYGSGALDVSRSMYTVDRDGDDPVYTPLEGPLPVGQVAVVFLAHARIKVNSTTWQCPSNVTPAMLVDPVRHGTSRTKAFHLRADAPVSAYSIFPYGGADAAYPASTLLLPVSSWETNYIAVTPFDFGTLHSNRTLQIVANEDDTEVRLLPTVNMPGGPGVTGAIAGVEATWTLAKGEVLQFSQESTTGSPIETTKPVGVFGGSQCTDLPTLYCDMLQQQIPPFSQWGTEYAAVPFMPRMKSFSSDPREIVPYTIVGAAAGTKLTYEPSRPLDAPETLDVGQSASFMTDTPFVVKSQDSKHPFHVSVYMTGSMYGSGMGTRTTGDPEFVNVPPSAQFLDHYVFFTDFTYADTSLTVVRRKTAKGFSPVVLECGGEITNFKPVGTRGEYEFAWVQLTSSYAGQKVGSGECGYGRHEARSDGPFAITVWGTGKDTSYGYVGGMGLRPANDATPPSIIK